MSVLDLLIDLEEKEVYVVQDKMKSKRCYLVKSLLLGKGKFANQEYSVAAYLQLAPQVTGKFSLPNRYGNDSKKKLTQIKIDEIHDLMRGGRKFYVVKHGSHAGSADIDLISPDEAVLPYAMYDGKLPFSVVSYCMNYKTFYL